MTLREMYDECVWTCQRMGAEISVLEDYLYDELGLEGDELIDCVKELAEYKWMYEDLCK
jgi:hypothetical protein